MGNCAKFVFDMPDPILNLLQSPLVTLAEGFQSLPKFTRSEQYGGSMDAMAPVLEQVAGRLTDNFPYHHPLYAGQMLKPPLSLIHI